MQEYMILYVTPQGNTGSMVLSAKTIVEAAEMAEAVREGLPEQVAEITEIKERVSNG